MADNYLALPGLEHLIAVLKFHGIGVDPRPHASVAPHVGERVLGEPFDPILAAMYTRFNGGLFGDLGIFSVDHPDYGIVPRNASLRTGEEGGLTRVLCYGRISGFAYYFATAPSLAGPGALQPVIHIDMYEERCFLPIASNVDRAFDLYAHYCDAQLKSTGSLTGVSDEDILFPEYVVNHIACDSQLVKMIEQGHFEEFVAPNPVSREWVQRILSVARDLA